MILIASYRPYAPSPINAIHHMSAIVGFLIALIVVVGLMNKAILRIQCPKKIPNPNPNTLTILKNGTYPAKSSSHKIKGMLNETINNHQNVFLRVELSAL
jgi:hypothetical protein